MATTDQVRNGRLPLIGTGGWAATMKRVLAWAVPLTALAMLALMLVPAETWRQPADDAVYYGFDPNLMYVNTRGGAPSEGVVSVLPQSLELTALPDSRPTVHLVTSPLNFRAAMNVRVLEAGAATIPLRIDLWSPRNGSGYMVEFGPPPDHLVTAHTVANGAAGQTLTGGDVLKSEILGSYAPGRLYHLEIVLDKRAGVVYSVLSGREAPPNSGAVMRLVGGPADPAYREILSRPVPVRAGKGYTFGGFVKRVSGVDAYKIAVQWLDQDQNSLGFANDWRSARELEEWTAREFASVAPRGAAFARMLLGSGNGTQVLYADLFLREAGTPGRNLLSNGDLRRGAEGWQYGREPSRTPEIHPPQSPLLESSVTVEQAPAIFSSLRLSLTASASSRAGIARATVEDYRLTLPHQRWQVVRIADARATWLTAALLAAGALLCLTRLGAWGRTIWPRTVDRLHSWSQQPVVLGTPSASLGTLAVIGAYVILNLLLFNLGSHPFDMTAAKIWTYIAAVHGPLSLHHLPHTVSLARVWGGAPYHEAVFPYHPVLTYYVTFIGWIYKTFFGGPGPLVMDTFQLELLIKGFNVLIGLGDAILIYLILRALKLDQRSAVLAGGLFLLNPAIWFSTSVWGQNHVVTLFPLLLAIWMAETRRPLGAWLALAAGALTRPQTLVPAFLLGVIFLRKFSPKENAEAMAWTIIVTFVLLGPLSLAISPSLWVDTLAYQLFVQEAGGNEAAMTVVSLDAYNIWALVTQFAGMATGLARFQFPSGSGLIGALTYLRASEILVMLVLLGTGLALLLRRGTAVKPGTYLPLLALGTAGFLVLKTGLAASHFVIALPFLLLCRDAVGRPGWYAMVGIWTVTTLVSMYGSVGFGIWDAAALAPALHDTRNAVTRFFMNLHSADWFITMAALGNAFVVGWLGVTSARRARSQDDQPDAALPADAS
ncbi:MAG: hypothetical protein ACRDGN_11960 [bacterium]